MQQHKPRISERIRTKLLDTIAVSPVTIVVGPTGCGKSTQVPSALLLGSKDDGRPIVCTQPRRLAVVAVATRVAQERGVVVGGSEVGYHVGQSNHSTSSTKLLFTTAGILLEELRAHGVTALTKNRVVIIDECHERSPESDLVLALIRSMLLAHPSKQIRIVLMSATFDHGRYQRYFSRVPGCERIEAITLETASSFDNFYERVETSYLDDIIRMLPQDHKALQRAMRLNPQEQLKGKSLSDDILRLICDLVVNRDAEESPEGVFVIFAPTYRHLEQIYFLLKQQGFQRGNGRWKVGVLHSSVDMEFCLQSMSASSSHTHRKILLASAIADSSVTIPGVTCVFDLCRALQVRWDVELRMCIPKTVWASKSICDQRKGRTGRTCAGKVFRFLPQGFFISNLENWEVPQLTLSSCRDEVLKLVCAGSVGDVSQLLGQCLDPPSTKVIQQAVQYLTSIGACVQGKKRLVPTQTGELLAVLPFQVEDSRVILSGCRLGLMHEILAMRAISCHKPAPIAHEFGNTAGNEANARAYYPDVEVDNHLSLSLANLSAFMYWDSVWNGSRSRAAMQQFAVATESLDSITPSLTKFVNNSYDDDKACCDVWKWTPELEESHIQWCESKAINPTSVRGIAELIDNTINILYMGSFEPEWLRCSNPIPPWHRRDMWQPTAVRKGSMDMMSLIYGSDRRHYLIEALSALTKKKDASSYASNFIGNRTAVEAPKKKQGLPQACIHFLQGNCTYGARCRNSHATFAVLPPCRFFQNGHCSKGSSCVYAHDLGSTQSTTFPDVIRNDLMSAAAPILPGLVLNQHGTLEWFKDCRHRLMLLGEGNFEFTRSLQKLGLSPEFATNLETRLGQIGGTEVFKVDATRIHWHPDVTLFVWDGILDSFSWNFPFTAIEEDDAVHESLILGTFLSLAQLLLESEGPLLKIRLALTLQGDQFSRWMIMRSAIRTGWRLVQWDPFDFTDYPGYHARRANGDTFPESGSRFYVFSRNKTDMYGLPLIDSYGD